MIIFFFFPCFFFFFFLCYEYNFFILNFSFLKKIILLFENFFNLNNFFFFWEFFIKIVFFLNFFVLFFLFFNFFLSYIIFFFNSIFFGLLNFIFYGHIFSGQFFLDQKFFWNYMSIGTIPHFFHNLAFFVLFITWVVLLITTQIYNNVLIFPIANELGYENNKNFFDYIQNMQEKDYYDVVDDISLEINDSNKNNTDNLETNYLQYWHFLEQEPYNIFNFENVEIQLSNSPYLLNSMMEYTYLNTVNRGNTFFNFNLGEEIRIKFFNFIKKFFDINFLMSKNSWKMLIDFYFFFAYLPCLFFVLFKIIINFLKFILIFIKRLKSNL